MSPSLVFRTIEYIKNEHVYDDLHLSQVAINPCNRRPVTVFVSPLSLKHARKLLRHDASGVIVKILTLEGQRKSLLQ